jgi:hypothetical protein
VTVDGNVIKRTPAGERLEARQNPGKVASLPVACITNHEDRKIAELGKSYDYKDDEVTYFGNNVRLARDLNGNIYLGYEDENRLEKYTPEGAMIFCTGRPVEHEHKYEKISQTMNIQGRDITIDNVFFLPVTGSIAVDGRNRLWVKSHVKKDESEEPGKESVGGLEFQIFDEDGVWLTCVNVPNHGLTFIFGDRLFFLDSNEELCLYEYKIVDLED